MRKLFWFLLPLLLAPLAAQQPRLHMDVPTLAARANQVSDVTLDGAALKLGMAFLNSNTSGLSAQDRKMLSNLQGIYVKSLEFDHAPQLSDSALAGIRKQLRGPGWSRIVSVRERRRGGDHETDEIYVCTAPDGKILGMAILSRQRDELDLVNIVGSISPEELTKLGGHLGIPDLETGKGSGGAR